MPFTDDDALKFRQAEKLLYESRLLQHVVEATVMKKREEGAADGDEDILNADPETPSSMYDEERRAMAYEKLGKMFLREKNLQMAKSYAMKAIEIRRNIQHAIEHPAEAEAKEVGVNNVMFFCLSLVIVLSVSRAYRSAGVNGAVFSLSF